MPTSLRLVKVIVQPVFVVDDGETLEEMTTQPLTVTAKDWPSFATEGFQDAVKELEATLKEREATE